LLIKERFSASRSRRATSQVLVIRDKGHSLKVCYVASVLSLTLPGGIGG
jgi:hypothetical protein